MMEPRRNNQQEAQQYAGYAGIETNRSDQSIVPTPTRMPAKRKSSFRDIFTIFTGSYSSHLDEETRLIREDQIWAGVNILMVPFGVLLIAIGVVVTLVNPAIGIATIISGFITNSIPVLASRPRAAAWKRLRSYRQQKFLEHLIETSKGELQESAFKAYLQLENPKDDEESR